MNKENDKLTLTPEQSKAVYDRDSNILVSAAAGSGKTKVLVDRILSKITDENSPVNVDEFLVVTFTNAAAGQMREKIAGRLMKALEANPESEHLSRQQLLINQADITTIDSFCLKVVKENINQLDIDSNFSIGDRGMMELIKQEVITRVFDEKYKTKEKSRIYMTFRDLVDIFDGGKSDDNLKKAVFDIYNRASSYPRPDEWLANAREALSVNNVDDIDSLPWMLDLIEATKKSISQAISLSEEAYMLCQTPGGPDKNEPVANSDLEKLRAISECNTYADMYRAMNISWDRLKACKGDDYNPDLCDTFKKYRDDYKALVKKYNVFTQEPEAVVEEMKNLESYLVPLINLVEEFSSAYMEEKKLRRSLDFSDVSHYAYRLLVEGYDAHGNIIPTKLAESISMEYREIYIDEYQDSNYLQEEILTAVSGIHRKAYNMFMVGDVKQSIYRFRMARPDLFIEKYNRYTWDGIEKKIELKNNFRSRATVLLPVNYFFYQLMGEDLGGINYDDSISLVPGMTFPECESEELKERISHTTELMIVDTGADTEGTLENETHAEQTMTEEELNMKNLELEAHMVAKRIIELTSPDKGMAVYDEELGKYRQAAYRDIVILSRGLKNVGDVFYNVLNSYNIPVYLEDPKGYFNAVEIKVIMSFLSVIDNSRQDIPLAAVLLSPIGELKERELAIICSYCEGKDIRYLYDKCELYMLDHEDDISTRLAGFYKILEELKNEKKKLSISALIWKALELTGYYNYVSAMPMGNRRRANLDMLIEKADSFEEGYYKGLFNFLRYVEKLKVNEVDFGEASIAGEGENVVRIMTMHASKGLEYPIVFVSALGKQFNKSDYTEKVIVHSDYFLAAPVINKKKRYQKKSLAREAFAVLNKGENISEELRILYVAMTRAKEKLILTGHSTKLQETEEKLSSIMNQERLLLPYHIRRDSQGFMQLIIAAMVRYEKLAEELKVKDMITTTVYSRSEIVADMAKSTLDKAEDIRDIFSKLNVAEDSREYNTFKELFEYTYPYKLFTTLKSKMSISDIKKLKAYDGLGYEDSEFEFIRETKTEPDDAESGEREDAQDSAGKYDNKKKKGLTGAERGTIVHKYMELMAFEELDDTDNYYTYCKQFRNTLRENGILSDVEVSAINIRKMSNMLKSSLGQRMIKAARRKELIKEQQFSIGIPAGDIFNLEDSVKPEDRDIVIVQGIIDAFFYEEDEIVVMDYKTDYADEETLIGRYKAQLYYYAGTLERLTGKRVKEKIIYSFHLEKEIQL